MFQDDAGLPESINLSSLRNTAAEPRKRSYDLDYNPRGRGADIFRFPHSDDFKYVVLEFSGKVERRKSCECERSGGISGKEMKYRFLPGFLKVPVFKAKPKKKKINSFMR